MNKVYCKFPFIGLQSTHKGNRLCCGANKILPDTNAEEFWHSDYLANVKNKMLQGSPVDDCSKCYEDEEKGKISLRQHYNNKFKNLEIKEYPLALDLDFSTLCNLKCIMCGPSRSSQWSKELGQAQIPPMSMQHIDNVCHMSKNVQHLTLQGGEPSIMPEFEYYFEYLKDNGLIGNIDVDCISNLTNVNTKFYKLLSEFKSVKLNVSLDAFGDACNYIRFPSNFKKIEENLLSLIDKKIQVNLQITLQTLSMFNFYDFLEWIYNMNSQFKKRGKKIGLNLSFVTGPDVLDINFAPIKLKQKFLSDIYKFNSTYNLKHEIKFNLALKKITETLISDHMKDKWDDLNRYIELLDQRRNTKITNFIPNFFEYS